MSTLAVDRHAGAAADAAVGRSAQAGADIYAEQVAMLYAGARTAALANMANAAILTFLLWGTAPARLLHGWLAVMVLVQLSRLGIASLYKRAQPSAYGMKSGNWDQWYLASVAAGGATWGAAGFWLFPQQAVELQLALIFVIAGTAAGATALLAPVLSAFSFFALPALVPLSLRFILEDTSHDMAMAVLTLIFLLVLLGVTRIIHATIMSSIRLRMENSDLVAALASKANNLQQINRLLGTQITERTSAEEHFRDQFLFLQQLIDAIPIPVFYKDTNGVYQGCNEALTRFLGTPKNNFIGKTVSDMVARELAEEHQRKDRELLDHGGVQIYESEVKAADGTTRHILFHKTLFRDPLDRAIGIIGTLVDLTERKRMEGGLLQTQGRLQLALKAGNAGLWSWDVKTNEVYISPSWKTQLGYADEEIQNRYEEFESRIHPEDLDRVLQQIGTFIKDPSSGYRSEFRLRHKDGSYRWIFSQADIFKNAEGQPTWFTGCNIDITAHKRTEDALRHERDLSREYLDIAGVMMLVLNTDQTVRLINRKGCEILGYQEEDIIGKRWVDHFLPERDRVRLDSLFDELKAGEPLEHVENPVLTKDGRERTISWHNTVLRDAGGAITGTLSSGEDITERKQMEAQASEIERLTALGQLTDGIAHEMKNPLFILTGRIQLLKEKLAQQEYGALPDDLQKIESAASRMTHIAERFSALTKPLEPKSEPTAVQAILKQALELLADLLMKSGIMVKRAISQNLPTITADPRQLQQAFTNLIMNAMEAMAGANGIGTLTVTAALQGDWIEVRVQDDGPGITPEHRARLFEPFFTTKPSGQGAGLGLWTVRKTAMALRGTVACETESGKGTTFIMRLPVEKTGESVIEQCNQEQAAP